MTTPVSSPQLPEGPDDPEPPATAAAPTPAGSPPTDPPVAAADSAPGATGAESASTAVPEQQAREAAADGADEPPSSGPAVTAPTRRPRRRRLRRIAAWTGAGVLATLVVLALVLGLVAVQAVRRPYPTYDGELTLPGLSAPVTVYRDAFGVPHLFAETMEDLYRAQGFVHAQDRFYEMDLRRHITSGRLAELFGEGQVATDAFLRTLGWRRVAEQEWQMISADARRYLTAYAEGVNAWIEHTGGPADTGRKALAYRVLGLQNPGYEVEPWDPVDSLAWLKAMAWDLRANMEDETDRALLLAAGFTREQVEQLYPPYPFDRHEPIVPGGLVVGDAFDPDARPGDVPAPRDGETPVPVERLAAARTTLASVKEAAHALPELLGTNGPGLGSNSWVLAGELTATGRPILANDPHLGLGVPNIFYQINLHCTCGHHVGGFSFTGLPGVIIGHTDRYAWGFTNLAHDVSDLYLERLDGDRYLVDGQWRDLQVREETIKVAGGEDVTIRVRHTNHGPLISDPSSQFADLAGSDRVIGELGGQPGDEYGVALAWTALMPGRTVEALFAVNSARTFDEFRQAAALLEVPAQNLVYADVDGTIGYQAPGKVPVRGAGDGRWIAPGWDPAYDWQGFLPFDQLPYVRDPIAGLVVTANQAPIGPQYQPWLSADWSYGYRSQRIHEMLAEALAAGPISVADVLRMQVDDRHPFAAMLVPRLLQTPTAPLSRAEQEALALLADWDHRQPAEGEPGTPEAASSAAAAYFNAVWRNLLLLTFDELPEELTPGGNDRWAEAIRPLLDQPDSPWWDRKDTDEVETRDDILAQALSAAFQELAVAQGEDPADWRWGRSHTLTLREQSLGSSGIGFIEAIFNRGPYAISGGAATVNATNWNAAEGYEVTAGPAMRMVVDLADLDRSRWILVTGASGHPYHPHYIDQLELWRTGETIPWRWERDTVEAQAAHTLVLRP